jgi:hypothetical protein
MTVSKKITSIPAASQATSQEALESCLLSANRAYLDLLTQPGNIDLCREAGRTVRTLANAVAGNAEQDGEDYLDDLDDPSDDD